MSQAAQHPFCSSAAGWQLQLLPLSSSKGEGNIALQGTAWPALGEDLELSCVLKGSCFNLQEFFSKYWCKWKVKAFYGFLRPSDFHTCIIGPQHCNASLVFSHQSSCSAGACFCFSTRKVWKICVNSYIMILTCIRIGTWKQKYCLKRSVPQGGKT